MNPHLPLLEEPLRLALQAAISEATGSASDIDRVSAIAGGSISRAVLVGSGSAHWFVKINAASKADLFAAEADGLNALSRCRALRVPRVVASGVGGDYAFLALEYVRLHRLHEATHSTAAGRALAELHRIHGEQYGWQRENYIGSTPQDNTPHRNWPFFFARRRLLPQLRLAQQRGYGGTLITRGERLVDSLAALFVDHHPPPSLLHGDLWSGNAATDERGILALFDPAVYFGDREADLAMTELFGGFPDGFYAAYRESWPLADGFEQRKLLYNLYHILNHLNLFGSGYRQQAERIIGKLLAEMGA